MKAQLAAFERDPELGIVYGEFSAWDPKVPAVFHDTELDAAQLDPRLSGWIYPELLLTNWVLLSTAMFRREVFQRIGKFNPELPPSDDWDVAVRASRYFRFAKLKQVVALYRQHAGQTSRRPAARDIQSDVRQGFIDKFGQAGPDGREVDARALQQRRYRGHFLHGHVAFTAGMHEAAAESFRKAWQIRRLSVQAVLYWLLSQSRAKIVSLLR